MLGGLLSQPGEVDPRRMASEYCGVLLKWCARVLVDRRAGEGQPRNLFCLFLNELSAQSRKPTLAQQKQNRDHKLTTQLHNVEPSLDMSYLHDSIGFVNESP